MIIVQRLEHGSRCEYRFKSMRAALQFIAISEKKRQGDGEYEIYKIPNRRK